MNLSTVAVKPSTFRYFDFDINDLLTIYRLSGPIYEWLTWLRDRQPNRSRKQHHGNAHAVTAYVSTASPVVTARASHSIPAWL